MNNAEYLEVINIRGSNPFPISLLGAWCFDSEHMAIDFEQEMHEKYYKKRTTGEWFKLLEFDILQISNDNLFNKATHLNPIK